MKRNGFSSLLNTDAEFQSSEENKIELLGCPFGGNNCKNQLAVINNNYRESAKYQQEKSYQKAIELLKSAYYKTHELQQSNCVKCVALFRTTITNSLEDMHKELERMSTGIFRNKRYHGVYVEAGNALKELNQNNHTKVKSFQTNS